VPAASLGSLLLVLVFVASDIWVFVDAKRCSQAGSPVFLRIGRLSLETPLAWFVGCVLLWIFFFPMYLVSRSHA
jgi:hypothetical protein